MGPVGWAPEEASQQLYLHSQQGTSFGNASRLVATAVQAGASLSQVSNFGSSLQFAPFNILHIGLQAVMHDVSCSAACTAAVSPARGQRERRHSKAALLGSCSSAAWSATSYPLSKVQDACTGQNPVSLHACFS